MNSSDKPDLFDSIAITGMAGRFPGARNISEFWQNLRSSIESITFFSDEELKAADVDPALLKDPNYVKAGAVLDNVEMFDAGFFGYTPREAAIMDPQHRFFLECAWEALEDSGVCPDNYAGPIGVYAGVSMNSYLLFNLYASDAIDSVRGLQTVIGNNHDFLTTRVSYKLDLKGPSLDVQTSCSTSLVAVHLACQSLLNGECDMALAGGVSIVLPQNTGYLYQEQGIYSPDGHCRAFDARAQGTTGGRGAGVVVLKRFEDAQADGDHIYAVIRGSAINNDGCDKVGYTAPSVEGQARVITEALAVADVEPETISYIEAHGTGTPLGDPIEIEALTQAFRTSTDKKQFCAIGTVKTNIGHLDAAAGVTGLIKTALALYHRELPASLNFEKPNPKIDFINSPFYVNAALNSWQTSGKPLRAGVSSFGMGGTNAHVVMEEAPPAQPSSKSRPWQLLLLSARNDAALDAATANITRYMDEYPGTNLADIGFTLQTGRKQFGKRRMLVCETVKDARQALGTATLPGVATRGIGEIEPRIAFMFPGQGAQYVNMGLDLYRIEPTFRKHVTQCSELLQPHLNVNLVDLLYPDKAQRNVAADKLKQTDITQPALFVIEYALARLWMSWGLRPEAMIGHSIGEYVAACLSGVFSLEDALTLVAKRGRLMHSQPPGAMLAVPMAAHKVENLLNGDLSLAVVNEPELCVVSGPDAAISELEIRLAEKGCRRLHTSHAFHSGMMDNILEEYTEEVRKIALNPPRIPYISNVSGDWITAEEATEPAYWARHLRETVRFADGIKTLLDTRGRLLLEVGPGVTLTGIIERVRNRSRDLPPVASLHHAKKQQSECKSIISAIGQLWLAGVAIDWPGFYANEKRQRVSLPTYPFQRQRFWIESKNNIQAAAQKTSLKKTANITDWFYLPSWKRSAPPVLKPSADSKYDWLVFDDDIGLCKHIAPRLLQMGHRVFSVKIGLDFSVSSEGDFTVNPHDAASYRKLITHLYDKDKRALRVIHAWGWRQHDETVSEQARIARANDLGFYSLVFLAQAFGKQAVVDPLRVTIVTSDTHQVTGEENLAPEKTTVLGAAKVIHQEYPHIQCHAVDIVFADSKQMLQTSAERLLTEALSDSTEPVVAYRSSHRWVQAHEPLQLAANVDKPAILRKNGVYLITGGLGGVGLEVARYFAKNMQAHLVLTGRSQLPEPGDWKKWLADHDELDGISTKIRHLQDLETLGARILYLRADVTNEDDMSLVFDKTRHIFGDIQGVVHAAGAEKSAPIIQNITRAECEQHFAPKLTGLLVLEKVLLHRELDFCLLQSSLSSVLGALGFVAYTAAHLFLDAFVLKHNCTHSQQWQSVNWDNWLNWKEAEMLSASDADFYMTPDEGAAALNQVFHNHHIPQLAVSTGDLNSRLQRWVETSPSQDQTEKSRASDIVLHARPELGNAYAAPRNFAEETLAQLWAEALGIEQVGIHDNYFELGGDSVLSIQMIAKASQSGLRLNANQLFEHQTVAELAKVAGKATQVEAEQGSISGSVALTPIQHWFFEQDFVEPAHFNLPALFEVRAGISRDLVREALQHVFAHHDVFRLRFRPNSSVIEQYYSDSGETLAFEYVELAEIPQPECERKIAEVAIQQQTGLNLQEGPLAHAAYFDYGKDKSGTLLLVVHHLVIDVVSWRILMQDLQTVLQQLFNSDAVQLPAKTTSFKQWSDALLHLAESDLLKKEQDFWLSRPWERVQSMPVDSQGANLLASMQSEPVALAPEATRALLTEVPKTYNTQINDILLTALLLTFKQWSGETALLFDLEGHGRENIADQLDLSRTVGWFTSLYPVLLAVDESEDLGHLLKSVKEQLRAIPGKGIGYGVLRYLHKDDALAKRMRSLPAPEISFLYMGQFDKILPADALLKTVSGETGQAASPQTKRSHLFDIVAVISDRQLRIEWMYCNKIHKSATVKALSHSYIEMLNRLIEHCQSFDEATFTPSDFPGAKLSQKDLDILLGSGNS